MCLESSIRKERTVTTLKFNSAVQMYEYSA